MEKSLYQAAIEGNVPSLLKLLRDDPLLLGRCVVGPYAESPLHVASLLGHVEFVNEILSRNPELASEVDSQGSTPVHLAAAKGHLSIVKNLLVANPDMCFSRDKFGRNPVHVSAIKGRVDVLQEMVQVRAGAATERMSNGDTILHLCVRNNKLECLKVLVLELLGDEDLVNSKNGDGDTILHLAVADQQSETINFLIDNMKIETSSSNQEALVALEILARANIYKAKAPINYPLPRGEVEQVADSDQLKKPNQDWLEKMRSALMVVAILTATMAFQVGINPPGGVWQDNSHGDGHLFGPHKAGFSIMADNYPEVYSQFLTYNTISFVASLSIILLLISGLPLRRRVFVWVLMLIMWSAIICNGITYLIAMIAFTPTYKWEDVFIVMNVVIWVWIGLIALLIVVHMVRQFIHLVRKTLRKRNIPSTTASTDASV